MESPITPSLSPASSAASSGKSPALDDINLILPLQKQDNKQDAQSDGINRMRLQLVELTDQVEKLTRMMLQLASHSNDPRSWTVGSRPAAITDSSGGTNSHNKPTNNSATQGHLEHKPYSEQKMPPPERRDSQDWSVRAKERTSYLEYCVKWVDPINKQSTYQEVKTFINTFRQIVVRHELTYDDCFFIMDIRASEFQSWMNKWQKANGIEFERFWTMLEDLLLEIKASSPIRNPHHEMLFLCKQTGTLEEYHEDFCYHYRFTDLDFRNDLPILTTYLSGLKSHLSESLVRTPLKNYHEAYEVLRARNLTDSDSPNSGPQRRKRDRRKKANSIQLSAKANGRVVRSSSNQ